MNCSVSLIRYAKLPCGWRRGAVVMLPRLAVAANASGKTLKQHAADFLKMHENLPHRSDDSLAVYTAVTNSFLASTTAIYPNDINQDDVIRWLG